MSTPNRALIVTAPVVGRALCGAALGAAMLLSGCAEQAFSAHSRDNNVEDVQRALSLSKAPQRGPQNGTGHPMAFVVTAGAAKELAGIDLQSGTVSWKIAADVRSRVAVGRGLIAHRQGERDLVGRDPQSGRERFTIHLAADERFMGLAVDEEHLYYVVQASAAGRRVSYTVGVSRSGAELWRTPAAGSLAAPAARGGLVAVPFAYQNVSLLDGATGKEVGRIRAIDEQITFVRAQPEGLFYGGGKGIYLLDAKSISGTQAGSSYVEATLGSAQMRPFYSWDGYQPAQSDYSAFDRNRLLWHGVPAAGGVAFESDLAILHSYRYLFAFDARSGKIRWAYGHPRVDVVASEDVGGAVVFAAADGEIGALDETTGRSHSIAKTGLRITGATIDADGLRVEAGTAAEALAALRGALEQIIWDPDARFTAVKVFATGALGDVPGVDATKALIKIVRAQSGVPQKAQKRAGEALIARKDRSADKLLLEALATHSDYLVDRRAVGIEVFARAAAEIGVKDAAPLIGAHLADPETPQTSLKELVLSLGILGGKEATQALRSFLLTYRADPMFLHDPAPLTSAGAALLKLGPDERRTVSFVVGERRTLPPVAVALKAALAPEKASEKKAEKSEKSEKAKAQPAADEAQPDKASRPPSAE